MKGVDVLATPCVFLDRDGTINIDKNYLHRAEDFEFEGNAVKGLKRISEKGYKLVVITNQSGIGRGYYGLKDANQVNEYMKSMLKKENVEITDIYICPHSPDENCDCRKPKTGLFEKAIKEHNILASRSFCVGDKIRDVLPAHMIGSKGILVKTGQFYSNETDDVKNYEIYEDLYEFAKAIPEVK